MTDQATEPRQAFSARVPSEVWEAMEDAKWERYEGDRTALVEAALRNHLGLPVAEQGSEAGGVSASAPVQAPPRLLVDVVADRMGQPRALVRRWINRGDLTLDGEVVTNPGLDFASLSPVEIVLNGSPV